MADSTNLDIIIRAKDEATKVLNSVGGSLKGFGSQAKEFLGDAVKESSVIAAGGFALVGAAAKNFAEKAMDVESAQAQLEHAVIGVSHATKEQLAATEKLADSLEKKGVLDGDNIKIGLAQLSTFGLSNKAVQALGGSLADLAVNQFGVSATGDQLTQSANMIAKALNGQFGVLEKSGIRFTDAQKRMIEFGTETQKTTAINEGFAQNLKYTNEVARNTSEGALAHMKVALENIQETIGGVILNAIQPFIAKATEFIESFNWEEAINKAKSLLEDLTKKINEFLAPVIDFIEKYKDPLLDFFEKFGKVLLIVIPLMAGLGLVISIVTNPLVIIGTVVGLLWIGWNKLVDAFNNGNPVLQIIVQSAQLVWTMLKLLWQQIQEDLLPALERLWKQVGPSVIEIFKILGGIIGGSIVAGILLFIEGIKVAISVITHIIGTISDVLGWFSKLEGTIDRITHGFFGLKDAIKSINLDNIKNLLGGFLGGVFGGGKAIGGPVAPGTTYLVGEHGPELFTPGFAGNITPNNQLGGSQNISINIYGNISTQNGTSDIESLADRLGRMLQAAGNGI